MPVLPGSWYFNCNWREKDIRKHFWEIKKQTNIKNLFVQVWWKGKALRRQFCPFKNQQGKKPIYLCQTEHKIKLHNKWFPSIAVFIFSDALERMQNNVSVSVAECQMREGGTGLSWNVTAPCRLEAEVWLCKKDLPGGQCEEVTGSRQKLHNYVHAGWSATRNGHWVKMSRKTCCTNLLKYLNFTIYISCSTLPVCFLFFLFFFIQYFILTYKWQLV